MKFTEWREHVADIERGEEECRAVYQAAEDAALRVRHRYEEAHRQAARIRRQYPVMDDRASTLAVIHVSEEGLDGAVSDLVSVDIEPRPGTPRREFAQAVILRAAAETREMVEAWRRGERDELWPDGSALPLPMGRPASFSDEP